MYEFCSAPHGIEGETSSVAEHVEHFLALGETLEQRAVLALVNEESCFLSLKPIDVELQSVLHRDVVVTPPDDESVLLSEFCFIWQCCLAFVIDVLYAVASYVNEAARDVGAFLMDAYTMSLHDGGVSIHVNDESRQVVAFAVDEAVGVVTRIVGNADGTPHSKSRAETA